MGYVVEELYAAKVKTGGSLANPQTSLLGRGSFKAPARALAKSVAIRSRDGLRLEGGEPEGDEAEGGELERIEAERQQSIKGRKLSKAVSYIF